MVESIVTRLYEFHKYESMSLEEILYESAVRDEYKQRNKEFDVGDIVLTKYYSTSSHQNVDSHRIMIITKKEDSGKGYVQYEGLPLKSVHKNNDKSNKAGRYPNSIYIRDYSSILIPGDKNVAYPPNKEAFIDVSDLARFRSYEVSPQKSSYAGHVKDEFYNFAMKAYRNYKSGKDNSSLRWE